MLLDFGSSIDLDSVTIGWPSSEYDTDITVLRYVGSGNPWTNGTLLGKSYGQLTGVGGSWSLVGHYADLVENVAKAVNSSNFTSQYWLISAYTTLVGGSALPENNVCVEWKKGKCKEYRSESDYFKLLALTAGPPERQCLPGIACAAVPEPGTLGLLVAALAGGALLRRRRRGTD